MKGVIDRIEGNTATILIESEGRELTLKAEELPEGATEDTWLSLETEDEKVVSVEIDEKETEERKESAEDMMRRLREDSGTTEFERVE